MLHGVGQGCALWEWTWEMDRGLMDLLITDLYPQFLTC